MTSTAPPRSAARSRRRGGTESDTAGAALNSPGSTSVSCLLMQDTVAANVVSAASGHGHVALFANPYLAGKEEALVIDEAGHLTYLRRVPEDTLMRLIVGDETGWEQITLTAADGTTPIAASEVVVVVHPQDRSLWALYSSGAGDRPLALRLVGDQDAEGTVKAWSWQAEPDAFLDYGAPPKSPAHFWVSYDGRKPVVLGVDLATGCVFRISARTGVDGPQRFACHVYDNPVTAAGPVVRIVGGSRGKSEPVCYVLVGQTVTRYDLASSEAIPIARDAQELVGMYETPYGPDFGCVYRDSSKNLVTCHQNPAIPTGWTYTYTALLDFVTATTWLDVDGLLHVYGLDSKNTLRVLHQSSWGVNGVPLWSAASIRHTLPDPPPPTVPLAPLLPPDASLRTPVCTGLVPGVVSFALDPFPDQTPSQLVRLGDSVPVSEQVAVHTQDLAADRWVKDSVRLPTGGAPHLVNRYVSNVTIRDRRGQPMPFLPVRVSAESLVEIRVDGLSFLVGPGHSQALRTDAAGKITIASPADSLLPATLHVDATGLEKGAYIQPASAVHEFLAGTGTLPSQPGVFDGAALYAAEVDKQRIVGAHDKEACDKVAASTQDLFKMAAGKDLTSREPRATGEPAKPIHGFAVGFAPVHRTGGGPGIVGRTEFHGPDDARAHRERIRALPEYGGLWDDFVTWAGDVWEGIKNGVIEVCEVVAESVLSVFVYLGGKIVELVGFVVDTVETAVRAVEAVVREVVAAVGKVVDWLKSLFSFQHIWHTKTVLEALAYQALDYGAATIEHYSKQSATWFEQQRATVSGHLAGLAARYEGRPLGDAGNQVPAVPNAAGQATDQNGLRGNPQATWMLDQVSGGRAQTAFARSEAARLGEAAGTDGVAAAFEKFYLAVAGQNIGKRFEAETGAPDTVLHRIVDPGDPDLAAKASTTALVGTLEEVADTALSVLDGLVGATLTFVRDVAGELDEVWLHEPDFGPVGSLYEWVQSQAGVAAGDVEPMTLGGLMFLVAAFFATTGYKLAHGVDEEPFPGGMAPVLPAPRWHPDHDPLHPALVGGYAAAPYAAAMKGVQALCGLAGVVGAPLAVAADLAPVMSVEDWSTGIDLGIAIGTTVCDSILFHLLPATPGVAEATWDDPCFGLAFAFSAAHAIASVAAIGGKLAKITDTAVLKNLGSTVAGPPMTALLSGGHMVSTAIALANDEKTKPYTWASAMLSSAPGVFQLLRTDVVPVTEASAVRTGIVAAVDLLGGGVAGLMMAVPALMSGPAFASKHQDLPNAKAGDSYTAKIRAEGGDRPFDYPLKNWQVVPGTPVPPGLTVTAGEKKDGEENIAIISWTPPKYGKETKVTFQLTCSDSFSPPQWAEPAEFSILVKP